MAYYHGTLVRTNGGPREALGGYSNDRFTEIAEEYVRKQAASSKAVVSLALLPGSSRTLQPRGPTPMKDYADAPDARVPLDIFGPALPNLSTSKT
jgi:hypothetical protein